MGNRIKQYSFKDNCSKIYLIATPIGNLKEMTPRAIEILQNNVNKIYCEDTRNTIKLLNYFNIKKELVSLNKENEIERFKQVLNDLNNNTSVAIISDAGYPLISDPGYYIVNKILTEYNYDVIPVSGSSATLNALVSSGLDPSHFLFYGFLSKIKSQKITELEKLEFFPYTIIFYEAPHRILSTLKIMLEVLGNRQISVGKEMTKIHEQFYRGLLSDVLSFFEKDSDIELGEYVIVINGYIENENKQIDDEILIAEINSLVKENNYRVKQAIDIVANKYKISKNNLYNKYHHQKEANE